jgi:hypothetical protein
VVDLNLGGVLLFLVPGLCVYAALYGLIGLRAQAITPAPPPANSVKAIMIVVLSSIGVHAVTALLVSLIVWFAEGSKFNFDIYGLALLAAKSGSFSNGVILHLAGGSLTQGVVAALIVRLYLWRAVRGNKLPEWLFGWTAQFANYADDHDKTLVALVLTTMDFEKGSLVYGGTVRDIGVGEHGEVRRIVLDDCQRYVIPLDKAFTSVTYQPLSIFDHFVIEQAHIRNITFEVLDTPS